LVYGCREKGGGRWIMSIGGERGGEVHGGPRFEKLDNDCIQGIYSRTIGWSRGKLFLGISVFGEHRF